jgi:hypothetical protein
MSGCWSDGELRAYVDRELPERGQVTAHLHECADCKARYAVIAARAERVSGLMAGLLDGSATEVHPLPVLGRDLRVRGERKTAQWVAAAMAMAAMLAAGFVMLQRPNTAVETPVASAGQPVLQAHVDAGTMPAATDTGRRLRHSPPRTHSVSHRPKTPGNVEYFVALDDEPIDTGIVMRVSLGDGETQADVIVGPDGQAHAVRLVK